MAIGDAGQNPDFRVLSSLYRPVPGSTHFTIVAAVMLLRAVLMRDESGPGFSTYPDNPDDERRRKDESAASLKRVLATGPDALRVQKYDIRRPESQGGGFEERYWSPVNSPAFGKDGELAYIIHRVEDVTEFVRLTQQSGAQARQSEALRSRAEKMEAEILSRASELAEANQNLRKTHEELKSALRN